jgi:hypothetical protein
MEANPGQAAPGAGPSPAFTSRQMVALSTVVAVAVWWAMTHMFRDALQNATLGLGPLGTFPCDEGFVPGALALVAGLLPQMFLFVRTWMKTGKPPSLRDVMVEGFETLRSDVDELKSKIPAAGGSAGPQPMATEQPPAVAPAPPPAPVIAPHVAATEPAAAVAPAHHA